MLLVMGGDCGKGRCCASDTTKTTKTTRAAAVGSIGCGSCCKWLKIVI